MTLRNNILEKLYSDRGNGTFQNMEEFTPLNSKKLRYAESKEYQRIILDLESLGYIETNVKIIQDAKKYMPKPTPPIGVDVKDYHHIFTVSYPQLRVRIKPLGEKYYKEEIMNLSSEFNSKKQASIENIYILEKIDNLEKGQIEILENIKLENKRALETIKSFLSISDNFLIEEIERKIQSSQINNQDFSVLLENIEKGLEELKLKLDNNNPRIIEADKLLNDIYEEPQLMGKFKLSIPLIPLLLKYETELNWDMIKLYRQTLKDWRDGKIFKK
jgi:hypothetical protein